MLKGDPCCASGLWAAWSWLRGCPARMAHASISLGGVSPAICMLGSRLLLVGPEHRQHLPTWSPCVSGYAACLLRAGPRASWAAPWLCCCCCRAAGVDCQPCTSGAAALPCQQVQGLLPRVPLPATAAATAACAHVGAWLALCSGSDVLLQPWLFVSLRPWTSSQVCMVQCRRLHLAPLLWPCERQHGATHVGTLAVGHRAPCSQPVVDATVAVRPSGHPPATFLQTGGWSHPGLALVMSCVGISAPMTCVVKAAAGRPAHGQVPAALCRWVLAWASLKRGRASA
jgi:hypothetical protein